MGKKNQTRNSDELALVKAAAWAWYQYGSGRERRTITEAGTLLRPRSKPGRTRYHFETLDKPPQLQRVNSLLDMYEIDRIRLELERFIVAGKGGAQRVEEKERKQEARRRVSGFWLGQAVGLCGAKNEVVEVVVGRRHCEVAGQRHCRG